MRRRGFTTGCCAAGAAKAATEAVLFGRRESDLVRVVTPTGIAVVMSVLDLKICETYASCAVRKDAGDDPDATNGVLVYARVSLDGDVSGVKISGGDGVGRVTRPGLDQPVGADAINSAPRKMIEAACMEALEDSGYGGGLAVVISIPDGDALSKKTFNPRLGIVGGLSVLGTTGVVEPMSCSALVSSIRAELSVLRAERFRAAAFVFGNYGEMFARERMGAPAKLIVKCSNYICDSLAAALELGFCDALLIGHIGKLVKLGIGATNTSSSCVDGRMETLIACALEAGAPIGVLREVSASVTADAAIGVLAESGFKEAAADRLKNRIDDALATRFADRIRIGVVCFCGLGGGASVLFKNNYADAAARAIAAR